jgi:two-component system, sensor histidine kinase and response regulator
MSYHILVAEDSRMQRVRLQTTLENLGYRVTAVADGIEALEALKKERPDLVLSDVEMPGLGGYELCRTVKNLYLEVPVVLLTSMRDAEDIIRGIQAGADNYLTKPCESDFLDQRLKALLQRPSVEDTLESLEVTIGGQAYQVKAGSRQILNLLLSTFENAVEQNRQLREANACLSQARSELEATNQVLQKLNLEKNEFLGMAAHDLRNPLSVIQGYSTFYMDRFDVNAQQERFLRAIQESSKRMLNLVNDLLDISAIESGQLRLERCVTDLAKLCEDTVAVMRSVAEKKEIRLIVNSSGGLPTVSVDAPKIDQVLTNLISNAIKYSHSGTDVEIRVAPESGGVLIELIDQGQGIPPQDQVKLFRPFCKTTVRTTGGESSTGLGLAIVKRIVEGHGGKIWVESQVGKGSTFSCYFPAG